MDPVRDTRSFARYICHNFHKQLVLLLSRCARTCQSTGQSAVFETSNESNETHGHWKILRTVFRNGCPTDCTTNQEYRGALITRDMSNRGQQEPSKSKTQNNGAVCERPLGTVYQ
jgi:hypothetical protein